MERTETRPGLTGAAALEMLAGDFRDKSAEAPSLTIETRRGPWTVHAGSVSLATLDRVQALTAGDASGNVPLANMAEVLTLLARTPDGAPMFERSHLPAILERVDPVYVVQAATFLAEAASASLEALEADTGKD